MLDSEKFTDQPGIEPGTFRLLVGCSTNWAIESRWGRTLILLSIGLQLQLRQVSGPSQVQFLVGQWICHCLTFNLWCNKNLFTILINWTHMMNFTICYSSKLLLLDLYFQFRYTGSFSSQRTLTIWIRLWNSSRKVTFVTVDESITGLT